MVNRTRRSHAILALLKVSLLVLVVKVVLLISHKLFTVYTRSTHQHTGIREQSCIVNKDYRLEQYTNSDKTREKVYKTNLRLVKNTQTLRSRKSELKHESYELKKISYSSLID